MTKKPTLEELVVAIDQIPDDAIKEQFLGLIQRCVKAEHVLRHIQDARTAFSLDSGGPQTPLEGLLVIEDWIRQYFDGTYYGDLQITISPMDG